MTGAATGVRWDLRDLYKGPLDPAIKRDLEAADARARAFDKKYKSGMQKLAAGKPARVNLASLLKDYKAVITLVTRPIVFAHLRFAEKTDDPERGAFLQTVRTEVTEIQSRLLFWEVHWNKTGERKACALLRDPKLAPDRHYLENLRKFAPHTLSEPEEKILSAKSNTSSHAFSRLFDEVMASVPFYIRLNGKNQQKTEGEILALFHSPARETRKKASESLAQGLDDNRRLLTYIYNMVLADHRLELKTRSYRHPSDPRNLANETDFAALKGLVHSVKGGYRTAARYYELKRALLGLDILYDYDRYAPVAEEEEKVDFGTCRKIVLESYYAFSPEAGKIAELFFNRRWIDAEIRPGKQGGGFSSDTVPELHPYILVNYTGNLRDVLTVAHELGHGIHQYLSRKAGILESSAPLTMAETASVFGEMLVFEKILAGVKDPRKRLQLLCGKIDDNFATVFRQIALTDFELRAHEAGMKKGELAEEELNGFWIGANADLYGKSVTLTDGYRHGWKYIPHFVHTPFYCYAYAFAQLFVLCLYRRYQEDPKGFVPKYFEMLSLGGSRRPEEIARIGGLDLKKRGLWEDGLSLLSDLVGEAEKISGRPRASIAA